jgi:hypothetical protein
MTEGRTLGDELGELGWSNGGVVPASGITLVQPYLVHADRTQARVEEGDWLVVMSHTCDLLARKEDAEPFVEVLHCKPVKKVRSEFANLRSTRTLDFRPHRTTHPDLALTAHALKDRYLVPRRLLSQFAPDAERALSADAARRIATWSALRASRPSWPDAFVSRLSPAKQDFEKALESLGDEIAEVRVALTPIDQELDAAEAYRVLVYFVVDELIWEEEPAAVQMVQAAFNAFVARLATCPGIDVDDDSCAESGGQFSWQQTRTTEEWNFANLTHRD